MKFTDPKKVSDFAKEYQQMFMANAQMESALNINMSEQEANNLLKQFHEGERGEIIPFTDEKPNKKYTEGEMKMALAYQKANDYQMAGTLLIGCKPLIKDLLDYLAGNEILSIGEIDEMLNDLGTNE